MSDNQCENHLSTSDKIKKYVVGRKIKRIKLNKFEVKEGEYSYDPEIELEDGTSIRFFVEEPDYLVGTEYGIDIQIYANRNSR